MLGVNDDALEAGHQITGLTTLLAPMVGSYETSVIKA